MTPNSTFEAIKAQLSALQQQASDKENLCNNSSSADDNEHNAMMQGASMDIIQEGEEEEEEDMIMSEEQEPTLDIDARFLDAAEKFNADDQDHMNRLIQFTMEVKAYSRYKKRAMVSSSTNNNERRRGGIRTPARRVLTNDEYLRDGIVGRDYLDVSFGACHGPDDIVSSPTVTTASSLNNQSQLLLSSSFIAHDDETTVEDQAYRRKTVQTLALLMQRIHAQQQLAIDNNNCGWSFVRAKEDLLSDSNAKELAVTWIALTELMRNFGDGKDETSSSDDSSSIHDVVLALFDEGEEYVRISNSSDAQSGILRNARQKYMHRISTSVSLSSARISKMTTLQQNHHLYARPIHVSNADVYSSCKTPISSKRDAARTMNTLPSSYSNSNTLSSTCKLAPDSVFSKDQDLLFSNDDFTPPVLLANNSGVNIRFGESVVKNPVHKCIDMEHEVLSPTENLRASFTENATIRGKSPNKGRKSKSDDGYDGLSTTPLRRSKRIASARPTPS